MSDESEDGTGGEVPGYLQGRYVLLVWWPTSGIAIHPCKKANRNLVIQTNHRGQQGRGYPGVQPVPCRSMYVSRYCDTSQSGPERLMSLLHGGYHSRMPSCTWYYFHSGPSPTANLRLLKLRLALSGSGSRNDPLHMPVPCTPRLLLCSALRCAALRCAACLSSRWPHPNVAIY